jgi:hypothetical protein
MNKPITELYEFQSVGGSNRMFRAFFDPDPFPAKHWEVGMRFWVVGVNRTTGEVRFSLDLNHEELPKEKTRKEVEEQSCPA